MEQLMGGACAGIAMLVTVFGGILVLKRFLYVCPPNKILIFSGRGRQTDAGKIGYRVIFGGRAIRIPILESVSEMDRTIMPIEIQVTNAYSKGGIPLDMTAIANVKISSDPQIVNNAIERFLGRSRGEILRVAKETLEGHLRGVLATLTPEEVNQDRLKFAISLMSEAYDDLTKLGLQLDTLKIQSVSDTVDYLNSIGRERIAHIIRDAEIAESNAKNEADQKVAALLGEARVKENQVEASIIRRQNELRTVKADLDARIRAAEEQATQAAIEAHMIAEQELQEIRKELERLRLEAERVLPAEANRRAAEMIAAGESAHIAEEGKAMALVLQEMSEAWKEAGPQAADILLLRQLEKILDQVADSVDEVEVGEVNLVDAGDGQALPAYVRAYPAMVTAVLKELRRAVGIDVVGAFENKQEAINGPATKEGRA